MNTLKFPKPIYTDVTVHETSPDNEYYPGILNRDQGGNTIIDPLNPTEDSILDSMKATANAHNATFAGDIVAKYENTSLPESLVGPPVNGVVPDRTQAVGTMMEHADDPTFDFEAASIDSINAKSFFPDLNAYASTGDPRFSLGYALQTVIQEFQPRIDAFLAMAETPGAVGYKNGYLCDENDQPIAQACQSIVKLANRLFDSNLANPEEMLNFPPPTHTEVDQFFNTKKDLAFNAHADAFIRYIRKNFPSELWNIDLIFIAPVGFFFVKFEEKVAEVPRVEVRRYYPDRMEYISQKLEIPISEKNNLILTPSNFQNIASQMSSPILDYTKLA